MSLDRQQSYQNLLKKLRAVRRKDTAVVFANGIFKTILFAAFLFLLLVFIEHIAQGDIRFRTTIFFSYIILCLSAFIYFTLTSGLKLVGLKSSPSPTAIAMRVGEYYKEIRDLLANTLQILPTAELGNAGSPTLIYAAFDEVYQATKDKDFNVIINKNEFKRLFLFAFFSIATVFLLTAFTPLSGSLNRIIHFTTSFLPPAPFQLKVLPLADKKLRGEKADIQVIVSGTTPSEIYFFIRESQQDKYDKYTLLPDANGEYRHYISSLKNDIEYYALSPWLSEEVKSPIGRIVVRDFPFLKLLDGKATPPSYTRLSPIPLSIDAADVIAPKGTTVDISLQANKTLLNAELVFIYSNSDSLGLDTVVEQMEIQGEKAKKRWSVQRNGEYYCMLRDKDGLQNTNPVRYKIAALPDNSPTIALLHPQYDVAIRENALLPIKAAIADDYGFSSLQLHYRLVESKYAKTSEQFSSVSLPFPKSESAADISYLWNLATVGISPSDAYEMYLEIADNDIVNGPKKARTQTVKITLPSLDDVIAEADKNQNDIQKDLEKIAKEASQLQKNMEEIQKQIRKDKKMDWQEKKKMEDLLKQQEELQNKVEQIQKNVEKVANNLQENKAISTETLKKYQELQKLLQEIRSPELQRAMERMQQQLQQLNPQQLQEAMKNLQFNEEQFQKNIERTMNILKRLKAEQMTDALTKRAEEMEKKQQELQKQTENTNSNDKERRDDLAKKQDLLSKDLSELSKDLSDLEKLMKEIQQQMPFDQLEQAKQDLQEEQTKNSMENASENLEKGNMQNAQQQQKKAGSGLKKFAQSMKDLKKEMKKNLSKEVQRQMQKSISDILNISKNQEALRQNSQQSDPTSTQFPKHAQEQNTLQEQLSSVAQRMMELSQKSMSLTPEMAKDIGEALQKMQQSTEQLANRSPQQSAQSQEKAMGSLNKAAMQMQQALQQMKGSQKGDSEGDGEGDGQGQGQGQSNSPGSFMQKLQQMAGMQQKINQGMQRMQPGQNGEMTSQQQAELGRLAAQQGQAQRAMDELAKQQQDKNGKKAALGNLDNIAHDMKEVLSDMNSGEITSETIKRQERILSRLLDATLSMNERDYESKRESNSAQDFRRTSPAELQMQINSRSINDLLRDAKESYSKDYEQLIRNYFDALQRGSTMKP